MWIHKKSHSNVRRTCVRISFIEPLASACSRFPALLNEWRLDQTLLNSVPSDCNQHAVKQLSHHFLTASGSVRISVSSTERKEIQGNGLLHLTHDGDRRRFAEQRCTPEPQIFTPRWRHGRRHDTEVTLLIGGYEEKTRREHIAVWCRLDSSV